MVETSTILKYAALALVVGGIGAVVFAVVWALGTKLYDAMAPFFNVVDSILGSITAHPIAWIAAIGAAVLGVVGTYAGYKVYQHVNVQKKQIEAMKVVNADSLKSGGKVIYSQGDMDALNAAKSVAAADSAATNGEYTKITDKMTEEELARVAGFEQAELASLGDLERTTAERARLQAELDRSQNPTQQQRDALRYAEVDLAHATEDNINKTKRATEVRKEYVGKYRPKIIRSANK